MYRPLQLTYLKSVRLARLQVIIAIVTLLFSQITHAGISFSSPAAGDTWYLTRHYDVCWARTADVLPPLTLSIEKATGGGQRIITTGISGTNLSECRNWGVYHDLPQVPHRMCVRGTVNNVLQKFCSSPVSIQATTEIMIENVSMEPDYRISSESMTFNAQVRAEGPDFPGNVDYLFKIYGPGGAVLVNKRGTLNLSNTSARQFTHTYKVPQWGLYRNEFTVDTGNAARERDENNNKVKKIYSVNPEPDLQVYVQPNIPAVPVLQRRSIRAYVKNVGERDSPETTLRFWIKDKGAETYPVPKLKPGETWSVRRRPKWGLGGMKKFSVTVVGEDEQITELRKDNNQYIGYVFVKGAPLKFDERGIGLPADLRVRGWIPEQMRRNKKTPILLEVKNLDKSSFKAENIVLTATLHHAEIRQGQWSDIVTTFNIDELLPGEKRIYVLNLKSSKSVQSNQRFTATVRLESGAEDNIKNNTLSRIIDVTN